MKNKRTGLSLAEVLVATSIIAVAVYGMIMSITAQQMADGRMRDRKVLSQLHYQLVREVVKNQRNRWDVNSANYIALDTGGATIQLINPGLGNKVLAYMVGSYDNTSKVLTSKVWTEKTDTNPPTTLASSTITLVMPYSGNWDQVRP